MLPRVKKLKRAKDRAAVDRRKMAVILILVHPMSTLSCSSTTSLAVHFPPRSLSTILLMRLDRRTEEMMKICFCFQALSLSLILPSSFVFTCNIRFVFSAARSRSAFAPFQKSFSLSLSKTNERTKRPTEYGLTDRSSEKRRRERGRDLFPRELLPSFLLSFDRGS